jgi:ABC-type sugar transport system permease subunit
MKASPATRNRLKAYGFLLPNIVGFLTFVLIPVGWSVWLSFTDWNGFMRPDFVGLTNYVEMFTNARFLDSFVNTLLYTFFSVPFTLLLALCFAILLNNDIRGKKLFRAAFFLPYISASVAVAAVWQLLFHPSLGPINAFLSSVGVENPPGWLTSVDWALPGVIIVSIWKHIGYFMVIFLAGLQGIPAVLYEAAEIDGVNRWQRFLHVTWPMLSPTVFFASVIAVIFSFKVFDLIYTLTEGGPGRATNVLAYTVYQEAFIRYEFGYASAISYFLFALIMVVTLIQFRGQKKWVTY